MIVLSRVVCLMDDYLWSLSIMAQLFRGCRYVVAGLYFFIAWAMLIPVLLGWGCAVSVGQADLDLRVVPVAALAGWATWFAYRVWPSRR